MGSVTDEPEMMELHPVPVSELTLELDRARCDRRDLIEAVERMVRIYNTFVGADDVPLSICGGWMRDTEKLLRRLQCDGVMAQPEKK